MKKICLVGGTFGIDGEPGAESGYIRKLAEGLRPLCDLTVINGGTYWNLSYLHEVMVSDETDSTLLWFPNISNEVAKLLPTIRQKFPNLKLVISKNNLIGKYDDEELRVRRETADAIALVEFYPIEHGFGAGIHTKDAIARGFDSPQDLARNILEVL